MSFLKQLAVPFVVAGLIVSPLLSVGAPVYPLKQSANGRYLVDQNNAPCLIIGESPQALIANLTTNEAAMFFANRNGHGFNTAWVNLLCVTYTGGRADASTYDGILPFTANVPSTGSYDLTKPNEAYFARADQMINLAAQQGIQVLLDPAETGGFVYQGTTLPDNGTNRCRAYGQFLGNRYKNFPNIIWMSGNDFQNWRNPADDDVVRAVALGIQDTDTNHLQTAELDYLLSSSLEDTNWNSIFTLNATYTYFPTYARLQQDYNRTNFLPNFMVEANYEFESLQGPVTTAPILRKQEYWAMTCGVAGQMYGNHYTWPFSGGWQGFLDTPGAIQIGYLKTFFEARAWFNLVPDTNNTVVTAGFGTFSDTGHVADNDYLTTARTPDGSLVIVYTPIIRQFTVDMSKLGAPATTRWFDPSSGTFTLIAGSPFTNSGTRNFTPPTNNADGDGGWVLVLETNPPPDPPPPPPALKPAFIQQNYATPQTPQSQVAIGYPAAQKAGNANIIAVGWNDTNASINMVGDSAGNNYQMALATFRGNGMSHAIYYAPNISAGSNTVTVTFNQPAAFVDLRAVEYSGLGQSNAFDGGSSGTGVGTSADSGPVTITATNELIFGAGMTANAFTAPGGGFALRVITLPNSDIVEDEAGIVMGTYNATAALNSGAWLMQVVAFKAALPGAPLMRVFQTATNTVVVAWPVGSAVFTLQQNSNAGGTNWVGATNAIATVGVEYQATISPTASQMYYRLKYP